MVLGPALVPVPLTRRLHDRSFEPLPDLEHLDEFC